MTVDIKPLQTIMQMNAAVELQKIYWGDDSSALVPVHMLFSIVKAGGHVLAAFDGKTLVGVLVGFLGLREATRYDTQTWLMMSKRLIVLPGYRGQNIGYRLKMAQRDVALAQGIRLVTWTFDPTLAANAHLNIAKLGARCTSYIPDYFGSDSQHQRLSADRFIVDWWVDDPGVQARAEGRFIPQTLQHYIDDRVPLVTSSQDLRSSTVRVALPLNFEVFKCEQPETAQTMRDNLRQVFLAAMVEGYVVSDFVRDERQAYYILTRPDVVLS